MTPLLLLWLLGRRVQPLDRVAGARGRHVVRIRINTRRTRWTLKKTDVNANALHAADARSPHLYVFSRRTFLPAPSLPSLYHDLSFTFFICFPPTFPFSVQGCCSIFCHRGSGYLHVQYHLTQGTRRKRARCLHTTPPPR